MSLAAADVRFLLNIAQRMEERRLHVYRPGSRRSAAAIILRFGDESQRSTAHRLLSCRDAGISSSTLLRGLTSSVSADAPASLRMLFVRRADFAADRWSGNVTFPGGVRDAGDADDRFTAEREVNQMLGFPLRSEEFILVGRLRDCSIRSRHTHAVGSVQSRFVFLHTGEMTPTVSFARHEVDAVQWIPITTLAKEHVDRASILHPIGSFVHASNADSRLILTEVFSHAYLAFPSIKLPGQWHVWGLALRSASELLSLDDRPPIDWPLVSSNNPLLQHAFIDAFHGYYEVVYAYYRVKARLRFCNTSTMKRHMVLPPTADTILWGAPDHIEPRHIFFLLLDLVFIVFSIYFIADIILIASIAVRSAFGWLDADRKKERLHAYYAANAGSFIDKLHLQQQQRDEGRGKTDSLPTERQTKFSSMEAPNPPEVTGHALHSPYSSHTTVSEGSGDCTVTMDAVSFDNEKNALLASGLNGPTKDSNSRGGGGESFFLPPPTTNNWDAFRKVVAQWAEGSESVVPTHKSHYEGVEEEKKE